MKYMTACVVLITLILVCVTGAAEVCSQEKNGNVVIQAEDTAVTPGWKFRTDVPGYSGSGFITWMEGNEYQFEGKGELRYKICVSGGTYKVNIWSMRIDTPSLRTDEGNDVWIKVDGEYVKLFTAFGKRMNVWMLSTLFDIDDEKEEPMIRLEAGCQYFDVAARSEMYSLDRFILVNVGTDIDMDADTTFCTGNPSLPSPPTKGPSPPTKGPSPPTPPAPTDPSVPSGGDVRCRMPAEATVPIKSQRVQVKFENKKSFGVRIYKRTLTGKLDFVCDVEAFSQKTIFAYKFDMFSAAKRDGRCLRNMMVPGKNGIMRNGETRYILPPYFRAGRG